MIIFAEDCREVADFLAISLLLIDELIDIREEFANVFFLFNLLVALPIQRE
jgi:hypothetical protein